MRNVRPERAHGSWWLSSRPSFESLTLPKKLMTTMRTKSCEIYNVGSIPLPKRRKALHATKGGIYSFPSSVVRIRHRVWMPRGDGEIARLTSIPLFTWKELKIMHQLLVSFIKFIYCYICTCILLFRILVVSAYIFFQFSINPFRAILMIRW